MYHIYCFITLMMLKIDSAKSSIIVSLLCPLAAFNSMTTADKDRWAAGL